MKIILKLIVVSMVIFLAATSFSYAALTSGKNVTVNIIGTSVNLPAEKVMWHDGKNYVVDRDGKDYLVKSDDDGNAVVVERIHNFTSFINDPTVVIGAAPVYEPIYIPYGAVSWRLVSPVRVVAPIRVYRPYKVYQPYAAVRFRAGVVI